MPSFINLENKTFGKLTVIGKDYHNGRWYWICKCRCGNISTVNGRALTRTNKPTRSCGCLAMESCSSGKDSRNFKHGHAINGVRSSTLSTWSNMISRCFNEKNKSWHHYGGRGITVCDQWLDFQQFLNDMGERPKGFSIERIDCDGNYCPENCKWVIKKDQPKNTRKNIRIYYKNQIKILSDWCRDLKLDYDFAYYRIAYLKYTLPQVIDAYQEKRVKVQ